MEKKWKTGLTADILRRIIQSLGSNLPEQFLGLSTTNIYHVRKHFNFVLSA
jgi:hypothetical protein